MSDTVSATAPHQGRSESALLDAGAARLAPLTTAPQATPDPAAIPQEPAVTTAPAGQSDPQPLQDTPESTQEEPETGAPEAEPPPEPADPDPILFHLDDGTPVRTEEAKRGFLRQQDYSHKTNLLAQGRDQLLQTMQETVAYRETAAKLIYQHLPEVDHSLRATDPGLWAAQMEERREKMGQVAQLMGQAQVTREQLEAESQQYAQREIPRALGHWADKATELKEQDLARKFVAAEGIPEATIERIKGDPWLIRLAVWAAKHDQSLKGATKGGQTTKQRMLVQPSPSIAMVQTRPAPAGTARARQLNGQVRSGEAVPTRPGNGLRSRFDLGASRLAALPAPQRG